MPEPTLSDVHADLVGRFEHDKRLRQVEQEQAAMRAAIAELPRMEDRLMAAITGVTVELRRVDAEASTPRPIWPAVSALATVFAVLMSLFAVLYIR